MEHVGDTPSVCEWGAARVIRKRDGRTEPYEARKIVEAMRRAFADVRADAAAPAAGRETGDGHVGEYELAALLQTVERSMAASSTQSVEDIQDLVERALMERGHFEVAKSYILYRHLVERALMERGHFEVAKSYILYRHHRAERREARLGLARAVAVEGVEPVLARIQRDFTDDAYDLGVLAARFHAFTGAGQDERARLEALVRAAIELTSQEAPRWEFIAARLRGFAFSRDLAATRAALGITTFPELVHHLTNEGLYGPYILAAYSTDELARAAELMDPSRDELFAYAGLDLLIRRYVIHGHDHTPLESPQEMFLGIALHLAMNEEPSQRLAWVGRFYDMLSKLEVTMATPTMSNAPQEMFLGIALHLAMNEEPSQRLAWVGRFYDMLSKLEVTMATPTMSNARKPDHQLSSCFIDTVPDSLVGIYRSIDNFAQVSKYGGGMGMYLGKVRATGGSIRGFEGVAGGVIRWIRVINDTAVAVDQLGMRQGAVAVYLDAWHRDLPEFLNLRTNNGDDRMKAHDVFPAVCYPDLFWRLPEFLNLRTNNGDDRMKAHDVFPAVCYPDLFWRMAEESLDQQWHLMCPHDILTVKGYALEDSYGEVWERRYRDGVADPRIPKRSILLKDLVRLILKSAVETGTPFAFMRDTVNRANPNGHEGIIYCSNLCTEIAGRRGRLPGRMAPRPARVPQPAHQQRRRPHEGP